MEDEQQKAADEEGDDGDADMDYLAVVKKVIYAGTPGTFRGLGC